MKKKLKKYLDQNCKVDNVSDIAGIHLPMPMTEHPNEWDEYWAILEEWKGNGVYKVHWISSALDEDRFNMGVFKTYEDALVWYKAYNMFINQIHNIEDKRLFFNKIPKPIKKHPSRRTPYWYVTIEGLFLTVRSHIWTTHNLDYAYFERGIFKRKRDAKRVSKAIQTVFAEELENNNITLSKEIK